MEIRTFTNFWALERKLYTVWDLTLPVPVSLRVLGVFVGFGVPWWILMGLFQVSFNPPWYLLWIIPPAVLAWLGSKPRFEGKSLIQYFRSRLQYLAEEKRYKGALEPDLNKYGEPQHVSALIMTRKPRETSF